MILIAFLLLSFIVCVSSDSLSVPLRLRSPSSSLARSRSISLAAVTSPTSALHRYYQSLTLPESPIHLHHSHSAGGRRHRLSNPIIGSLYETYLMDVQIDGSDYTCVLDTGSSDFAVSADPSANCRVYYKGVQQGKCIGGTNIAVEYGDSANWTGIACSDSVILNGVPIGPITFAAMSKTNDMLECGSDTEVNCIIGLAFQDLIGPPVNYSRPFFDFMVNHTGIPAQYGLQCCGWTGKEDSPYSHGSIDFGWPNKGHFHGDLVYTPLTREMFWGVRLMGVRVGNVSVFPQYNQSLPPAPSDEPMTEEQKQSKLPPVPESIIDSGTSNLVFTMDIWKPLLQQLKEQTAFQLHPAVWRGELCLSADIDVNDFFPALSLAFPKDSQDSGELIDLVVPPCRYLAIAPASECNLPSDVASLSALPNSHLYTVGKPGFAFSLEGDNDDGIILGQPIYETFYTIHDAGNHRVGFAPIQGCKTDKCLKYSDKLFHHGNWPSIRTVEGKPPNSLAKLTAAMKSLSPIESSALIASRPLPFSLFGAMLMLTAVGIVYLIRRGSKRTEYQPIAEEEYEYQLE